MRGDIKHTYAYVRLYYALIEFNSPPGFDLPCMPQAILAQLVLVGTLFLVTALRPYARPIDNWLSIVSLAGELDCADAPSSTDDVNEDQGAYGRRGDILLRGFQDMTSSTCACMVGGKRAAAQHLSGSKVAHTCMLAVLWLLLISGAALKWAGLPASSSRIFGFAQIVLSSGVVVFGVVAVLINSAWAIAACRVRRLSLVLALQQCADENKPRCVCWRHTRAEDCLGC